MTDIVERCIPKINENPCVFCGYEWGNKTCACPEKTRWQRKFDKAIEEETKWSIHFIVKLDKSNRGENKHE